MNIISYCETAKLSIFENLNMFENDKDRSHFKKRMIKIIESEVKLLQNRFFFL